VLFLPNTVKKRQIEPEMALICLEALFVIALTRGDKLAQMGKNYPVLPQMKYF